MVDGDLFVLRAEQREIQRLCRESWSAAGSDRGWSDLAGLPGWQEIEGRFAAQATLG